MTQTTHPALIRQIRLEAEGIISIELEPSGAEGRFEPAGPGAHIDLHLAPGLIRSYSLVHSVPTPDAPRGRYVVAVLRDRNSRGGSARVHDALRVGQVLTIGAPRNHFALDETAIAQGAPVVLVAGGIGITPLYAMLQRIAQIGGKAHLCYAARSAQHAAYLRPIEALVAAHPGLQLSTHWDSVAGGPPDLKAWMAPHGDAAHYYACGPAPLLAAFEDAGAALGYKHLHLERFAAAPAKAAEPGAVPPASTGYEVELRKTGRTVAVAAGANLLDTLLDEGIELPYSCHDGICGACETTVIEGDVDHRDSVLTPDEQAANKTMMICVSGCRGPRLVLDA